MENIEKEEKLHTLMKEMTDELYIHFNKYMKTHEKVMSKINTLSDPFDISSDDKNELHELLKELLSIWDILYPVVSYFLHKNECFKDLLNIHLSLTKDLNMNWFINGK